MPPPHSQLSAYTSHSHTSGTSTRGPRCHSDVAGEQQAAAAAAAVAVWAVRGRRGDGVGVRAGSRQRAAVSAQQHRRKESPALTVQLQAAAAAAVNPQRLICPADRRRLADRGAAAAAGQRPHLWQVLLLLLHLGAAACLVMVLCHQPHQVLQQQQAKAHRALSE